jgi:hypothetical protein
MSETARYYRPIELVGASKVGSQCDGVKYSDAVIVTSEYIRQSITQEDCADRRQRLSGLGLHYLFKSREAGRCLTGKKKFNSKRL